MKNTNKNYTESRPCPNMNSKQFNDINNFITCFMRDNCDEDAINGWNSDSNQKKFSELFGKKNKGAVKEPKEKKEKKEKNVDGVKNPPKSGYLLFCQEKRAEIKEEFPEFSPKEITSELGRRWRELKDSNSDIYLAYNNTVNSTKVKKETKPKVLSSAYIFFCAENRDRVKLENPAMKMGDLVKHLSALWQNLKDESPDDYQNYLTRFNNLKNQKPDSSSTDAEEEKLVDVIVEEEKPVVVEDSFSVQLEKEEKEEEVIATEKKVQRRPKKRTV